jgi:hypothetical protein
MPNNHSGTSTKVGFCTKQSHIDLISTSSAHRLFCTMERVESEVSWFKRRTAQDTQYTNPWAPLFLARSTRPFPVPVCQAHGICQTPAYRRSGHQHSARLRSFRPSSARHPPCRRIPSPLSRASTTVTVTPPPAFLPARHAASVHGARAAPRAAGGGRGRKGARQRGLLLRLLRRRRAASPRDAVSDP